MDFEVRHYVEEYWMDHFYEGYTFAIDSREEYLNKVKVEPCFLGFRFFDREVVNIDGKEYTGEPINFSDFVKVTDVLNDECLLNFTVTVYPEKRSKEFVIRSIVYLDDYKSEVLGRNINLK